MDRKKLTEKKETVKDVLTTSSFEYNSDFRDKLINEKGGVNLSFGMRCFIWLVFSTLFILFLNVIGLNMRIRDCAKGIAVDVQNGFVLYEENMLTEVKKESELFKNQTLLEKLKSDPRKILKIFLNTKSEDGYAYYASTEGDVYGVDKTSYIKLSKDLSIYKEINKLLYIEGDIVQSENWFYEKSIKSYIKLIGYKIYNADGSLDGIIAYTNSISSPFHLITDIYSTVKEMKFYIFDENKTLIYTNNDDLATIETITKGVLNQKIQGKVIWNNDGEAETKTEDDTSNKNRKNRNIGSIIANIARNVGNNLKKDSLSDTVYSDYSRTGYFVVLDYKRIVSDILRNLLFFYVAGVVIFLTVLYVMTYFYKYSKKHAKVMLKTVEYGIGTALFVSLVFQIVSYIISSNNFAKVQGLIVGNEFYTHVTVEDYIEYAALINYVDLDTELENKKGLISSELGRYYQHSGIEECKAEIITNPSYVSEGIKQIINRDGVFVRFKKSGGERYLDFESVTRSHIRTKSVWIKLNGRIETKAFATFSSSIEQFGDFESFEIAVGDKTFRLDDNTKYYVQIDKKNDIKYDEKIEIDKKLIDTKIILHFDGYTYKALFKNYDITFVCIILAIGAILFAAMYFDISRAMKNTVDEGEQDTRYKHLLAEWLSGGITIIDENDRDKQAEYDEILLERLRKSNIERLTRAKKEESNHTDGDDEDETYSRIKKEKDIFGISLFKHKKSKISETLSTKTEVPDDNPQGTITELKETIVSTMQQNEDVSDEVFDAAKLKVAEERLAIKKVLDEIEEQKNVKNVDIKTSDEEEGNFMEELELSSKDEKLDEKIDKK